MSNHHVPRRALAAIVLAPLAASLACASAGAKGGRAAPVRQAGDTSSTVDGGGKTIENLFVGRFPGVSVARTDGGGLQIRIRGGSNSFYGSDEPLFVVDEIPLQPGSGGILFLNPYDIEKIEVLKNPADIGLYGIRGANGVIRITTTRPGPR
ncbi:MAG TPA: TonB-dependent receptor plug domain-containing protein [Gemmatimonadaceae bacterium]|nr:TonB-dependent receptor plug domain-containing protein [Gemmatimonadaceae bacterium]